MISIKLVPPSRVLEIWELSKDYIKSSFDLHPYEIKESDILAGILNGNQQLWVVYNESDIIIGAFTTSIRDCYGHLVGTVEYLGGTDISKWIVLLITKLENWFKEMGVKYIQFPGRRGWEKYTKQFGYNSDIVIYKKEISP